MAKKASKLKTVHNLPPKKTLKVVRSAIHSTLFEIVYHEGGTVEGKLRGPYNRRTLAEKALHIHLDNKEKNKSRLDFVRDKENAAIKDETGI